MSNRRLILIVSLVVAALIALALFADADAKAIDREAVAERMSIINNIRR